MATRGWLVELRKKKGLSQVDVANACGVGQQYISAIERGLRGAHLPIYTAKRLAKILGFDWRRLYGKEVYFNDAVTVQRCKNSYADRDEHLAKSAP